ncbi:arsenosugar biosynthesis radical SAM (seleno)protein ArsS [Oceanospirillum linum]|uniref:Radical SAM protein n=1 Tax=Oceanospirillum linum TaxID=966 RepID=A0A1T1HF85_OCELI|nr:arsenosugar biosynthesis radical SAM (seleno)protein ArsS [Oceanospirillum linum]OOV88514.1 radical SAM protein [Oceanospirillum linum]SEF59003.1 radical SAM/Cys-rich domain-containing protein [Oleiphilus messinensis]SMP06618.1 radical SAM/Cys-rich domain-containing protein [Oceanospirillum linum]
MLDTRPLLEETDFPRIFRGKLSILQVNLGYLCNLSCVHCHVNAGPKRTELMSRESIDQVLEFIDRQGIRVLDLTGGAPEMNPEFRYLVTEARKRGVEVIDRCNLTILNEPGYEDLAQFLADQKVVVTASLPCYSEQNVEQQRGKGVFAESIIALQKLNDLGFGMPGSGLSLNLVYNPGGPFLPPAQAGLQADYQRELKESHGIVFNELLTITNMPISRFGSMLLSKGQFADYMQLLKDNFSEQNLAGLMCRSLVSIDWQGRVYDCDFNQMLDMPLIASDRKETYLADLLNEDLEGDEVFIGEHCYGCTAGQGSSCGGALGD